MKKKVLSLILAAVITAASAGLNVSAETSSELAKGIVFTDESGIFANPYTGYVSGIGRSTTVRELLADMENSNGVEVTNRYGNALELSELVSSGDRVILTDESGDTVCDFTVVRMGDVNLDGSTNLRDITLMLKYMARWDICIDALSAADVNGDGDVTMRDVTLISRKIAGWDVSFVEHPVLPGKYEMVVKEEVPCYETNSGNDWQPLVLSDGIHYDVAVKFNVGKNEFATQLYTLCPSWGDNCGSLTFSVYKWAGDYDSTVASMPIVSQRFVDYYDNALLALDMTDSSGKGLTEGEYMWRIHDGYDDPEKTPTGVGIYFFRDHGPDESTGMKVFLNCREFNFGPVATITYCEAK